MQAQQIPDAILQRDPLAHQSFAFALRVAPSQGRLRMSSSAASGMRTMEHTRGSPRSQAKTCAATCRGRFGRFSRAGSRVRPEYSPGARSGLRSPEPANSARSRTRRGRPRRSKPYAGPFRPPGVLRPAVCPAAPAGPPCRAATNAAADDATPPARRRQLPRFCRLIPTRRPTCHRGRRRSRWCTGLLLRHRNSPVLVWIANRKGNAAAAHPCSGDQSPWSADRDPRVRPGDDVGRSVPLNSSIVRRSLSFARRAWFARAANRTTRSAGRVVPAPPSPG